MQEMNHKEVAAKSEEFKKVESLGKDGLQFADVLSETWGAKSAVKNDVNNGVKIGVGKEKELSFDDCYKGADKSAIKLEDGEIKGGKPAIKLEDGGMVEKKWVPEEKEPTKPVVPNDGGVKSGEKSERYLDFDHRFDRGNTSWSKPSESLDGGPKDIIKKPLLNLDEYSFFKKGA